MAEDDGVQNPWKWKSERNKQKREDNRLKQAENDLLKPAFEKVFIRCEVQNPEATIVNFFKQLTYPLNEVKFPVIHFNSYGRYYSHIYIPSEFGLGSFSLKYGISDESWKGSIIDPGVLPKEVSMVGVSDEMAKTRVPQPPYFLEPGLGYYSGLHAEEEFHEIFQKIVDHSLLMEDSKTGHKWHILFTPCASYITNIRGCILWLMMKCGRQFDFEILMLTTLMKVLSFQKTKCDYGAVGIWNDRDAQFALNDSMLNFVGSMGCKWHQRSDNAIALNFCATNLVIRSIYLALGSLCLVYGLDLTVPSHRADMNQKYSSYSGEELVGKLEFQQRFGLVPIDEETRKVLRRKFIIDGFLTKLKRRYPDGLQVQPTTLIWPRSAKIEDDLNYSKRAKIKITEPEGPPSEDEREDQVDWNWSGDGEDGDQIRDNTFSGI